MGIMLANCGKDEHGTYKGGVAGDQTGREWEIVHYYDRPWFHAYRHTNEAIRAMINISAIDAALNNNIGYDQGERGTFWKQLEQSSYIVSLIQYPCECDCSSGVGAILKAIGYLVNDAKLKELNQNFTTSSMANALIGAGFQRFVPNKELLIAGDILLTPGSHTAICVSGQDIPTQSVSYEIVKAKYKDARYRFPYKAIDTINLLANPLNPSSVLCSIYKGEMVRCYGYYNVAFDTHYLLVTYNGMTGYVSFKDVERYA